MKAEDRRRWIVLSIFAAAIIVSPLRAQQADPAASPDPAADQQEQPLFQVNVQVVTAPVSVKDSSGAYVTDLNEKDFHLRDNGKEQKIEGFELSMEPLSMVIAVETSQRVAADLPEIARSGILFTQLILGASGEAAVLGFGNEVNLIQDFTTQPNLIESAMRSLQPGKEDVRLSDALSRALFLLSRRPKDRRKVIVVISEARDYGSKNSPGIVLRGAQLLGVSVYTIGLNTANGMFSRAAGNPTANNPYPPGVMVGAVPSNQVPTPDLENQHYSSANLEMLPIVKEMVSYGKNWLTGNPLAILATGTGAMELSGGAGNKATEDALENIGRDLRSQYLLTYRPNNLDSDQFHNIDVQVVGRRVDVRTTPGYMYTRSQGRGGSPDPAPSSPAEP